MELTAGQSASSGAIARQLPWRVDAAAAAAWMLAFSLVLYLALSNGGYDTVVRSQVGIAVWWIVLIGALVGILPGRVGVAGWVAIGLLAAFGAWTALATGWSESAERSAVEMGRIAAYLGVLVLAIGVQGRTAVRHTINGLACAVGAVTLLAVLSRLHPQAFPSNEHLPFLGDESARKLSYPLNYWNGMAAFAALGGPLLLAVSIGARTLVGQAVAAAMLPLTALCVYLTLSRGGAIELVAGLAVFVAVVPRRLHAFGTLTTAAAGSAILLSAVSQRDALQDGAGTAQALSQGTEVLWLVLIVCAGVGLLQVAMGLAARHLPRPAALDPGPRGTAMRALAALAVVAVVALAAGAPGKVSHQWEQFKVAPGAAGSSQEDTFSRLQSVDGSGRYQFWQAALDANASAPWKGIGPGTFDFWWSRNASLDDFVRDAHSLYLETLAEAGIVGFALIVGLVLLLMGVALRRAIVAPAAQRVWMAGAAGGLAVFVVAAALDWVWEIAAIAVVAMVLGGLVVSGPDDDASAAAARHERAGVVPRILFALLAVAALVAIAVPLAGTLATRQSRAAAADGRLAAALADTRTAERLQPYAATPQLQRALVLEAGGAVEDAAGAARAATVDEPTNWRTWLVLARIEARQGHATAAVRALRKARSLNVRSKLFVR